MFLYRLVPLLIVASSIALSACSDTSCGPGTSLNGGQCLPAQPDGGAGGGVIKSYVSSLVSDRPSGSAVYVNHPIQVTFGAISQGVDKDVLVTLGLMEKPAEGATDDDLLLHRQYSAVLQ